MAIDQVIQLSAVGGDATASEIQKTSNALNGVTQMSRGMEEQFSHRFTHIGLQVFAGDMLRASGLGAETRQIIGTLQTSIMGLGAAFGAASGPILLAVSAIGALIGIGAKVVAHHKEEAEAIQAVIDKQSKTREGYDDEIKALRAMQVAGVALTRSQADLLKADVAVADNLRSNLLTNQVKEIEALEKQRDALVQQQQLHEQWAAVLKTLKDSLLAVWDASKKIFEPLIALNSALASFSGHMTGATASAKEHVTLTGQFKQKYDELTASIAKMKVQHAATSAGVTTDIKKMTAEVIAHRQARESNELAMQVELHSIRQAEADAEKTQMDQRLEYWIQNKQKEVEAQKKASEDMQREAKKYADMIAKDFGSAMARSIVEGKNFEQEMKAAFIRMAEQFIEKVIAMEIEWLILKAVMDIWPGGAEAFQGSANAAYPALAQGTYNNMDFGGAMATGGTRVVNKPTMFLAGESGPEIASFTPIGQSGGGGGGGGGVGTVNINLNVDHIDGNDPQSTLDMLSEQIRRETVSGRKFATTVAGVAARYPTSAY